ncbi:MAG: RNA 2',3'-cyclic phosphodiesterase [Gaiellales bacterium]|nr:RNA 2',3'-cyclic phosphodiesterase [Gaiellales bacterium]
MEQVRLFVGVPLPHGLLPAVQAAQEGLVGVPGLRLMRPGQLHVTLAFIGQTGAEKQAAARAAVETLEFRPAGAAVLKGYLLLPSPARARVVALGIEDGEGVFGRLFEAVMSRLEADGVMQREKRPFRPHLTIARLRIPTQVQPKMECSNLEYPVLSVCLYRSDLERGGARYTVVARRELMA